MINIDELKNQVLVLSGAFPELRPKEVLNVIAKLENIPESKINNNSESNYTTQNYQGAVLSTAPSTASTGLIFMQILIMQVRKKSMKKFFMT